MNNEKIYVSLQAIPLKGYYSEPIYDEAPQYGTYSFDVEPTIPQNTIIWMDDNGFVVNTDHEFAYGVSMHSGQLTITSNLKKEIGKSLKLISDAEYKKIAEQKARRNEILYEYRQQTELEWCIQNSYDCLIEDIETVSTKEEYDRISNALIEEAFVYLHNMFNLARCECALRAMK